MANISSDIYQLSGFINDIKKQFIDIPEDTLFMSLFGYTAEVYSNMLQNTVVMASEYSNESIPVKAKFEKNIITHALSNGITDINATPAKMTVLLGFLEKDIINVMRNDRFVFDKDIKIFIESFEFHTEYDIFINRNLLPNGEYTYTAQYDTSQKNPLSTIINPYLNPPARMLVDNEWFIYLQCDIRQYEQMEIYKKVLTDNAIENKTINFDFESQLASFEIDALEGGVNIHLTPVYEGLYDNKQQRYFYYSYIDSTNIRIKFDRDSYEPRINADITINLKTTQGSAGNFTYKSDFSFNIESVKYGYSNMAAAIKPISNSEFGSDKKTIEDLKRMIPKEALSRGSITNTSDLENFFNMIETNNSKLYFSKKRDNQLERIYFAYLLLKDNQNMIIPTNTISLKIKESDFTNTENNKYVFNPGKLIYYDTTKLPYGVVGRSSLEPPIFMNTIDVDEVTDKSKYSIAITGFDKLTPSNPTIISLTTKAIDIIESGGYPNVLFKFKVFAPDGGKLELKIKNNIGEEVDVVENGIWGNGTVNPFNLSSNFNSTMYFNSSCNIKGVYTITISVVDLDNSEAVIASNTVDLNIGGFIYTLPFMSVINTNPLYISYYLNIINMTKFLNFDYINQICKLQFISTHVEWKREYLTDRNTYKLNLATMQNIATDEGIIEKDDTGNIININMKVFAIIYSDNVPYRYIEGKFMNYDEATFIYNFQFQFQSNDVMNEDNLIRIENLLDIGTVNNSYGYLHANSKTVIYILSKQDLQYGRDDADSYIPGLDGYTLTNKYSISNGLDFFFNYSHIISSNVTPVLEEDGSTSYLLKSVPVVKQSYINNEDKIKNFIYQIDKRKEYINYSLSILEDSFGIDFKFFNTYGPSNRFTIDQSALIDKVNLTMRFKIKVIANTDKYIVSYITKDVKDYIEDINTISDLHIPNLITHITNKYSEQLVYFEFIGINDYGPGYQHVYQDTEVITGVVPEFLNINTLDNGDPDIDISIV